MGGFLVIDIVSIEQLMTYSVKEEEQIQSPFSDSSNPTGQ